MKMEQSVPKRRHIKFRRREITKKEVCKINSSVAFFFKYNQQTNKMQRYTFVYFCEMLYMFQAIPPPIIRSSKLYIQQWVLCQMFTATCHCHGRDLFHHSGS